MLILYVIKRRLFLIVALSFSFHRASEQPDESQPLQSDDNSQADICNQEEYDKIFRPNKEISRSKYNISNRNYVYRKYNELEKLFSF